MTRTDWSSLSRRRFTEKLVSLGVSLPAINGLSQEALADKDPEKEVPRLVGYEHVNHDEILNGAPPVRRPIYEYMLREDWVELQAAYQAARNLRSRAPAGVNVGVTGRHIEGRGLDVAVEYPIVTFSDGKTKRPTASFKTVKRQIPRETSATVAWDGKERTVSGIDVWVKRSYEREQDYYDYDYRPVPGGCQFSYDGKCTIASPGYRSSVGEYGWLTASHCVGRLSGNPCDQDAYGEFIGNSTVHTDTGDGDVAFIDSGDSINTRYKYAADSADSYSTENITGIVSKQGCEDAAYYGDSASRRGQTTGLTTGTVLDHYEKSNMGPVVIIDTDSDRGDSGGPYYQYKDGSTSDTLVMAVHSRGNDYNEDGYSEAAKGNTAYFAENTLGITI